LLSGRHKFMTDVIEIEVAYALPKKQKIISFKAKPGITALQAVKESRIIQEFPQIDLDNIKLGIFGKITKKDTELKAGDRVEIYRELIADPKEVRRQRAAAGKKMRKGGGQV